MTTAKTSGSAFDSDFEIAMVKPTDSMNTSDWASTIDSGFV
jgi:hypothetical protein